MGPGGNRRQDAPARTVLGAVGADVGPVMGRIEPESGDDDEHVRAWGVGRVDRDPAPRAGLAPIDVVLRQAGCPGGFLRAAGPRSVEDVVDRARAVLLRGSQRIGMAERTVWEILQLVARHEHRLHDRRCPRGNQRHVAVGRGPGTALVPEMKRTGVSVSRTSERSGPVPASRPGSRCRSLRGMRRAAPSRRPRRHTIARGCRRRSRARSRRERQRREAAWRQRRSRRPGPSGRPCRLRRRQPRRRPRWMPGTASGHPHPRVHGSFDGARRRAVATVVALHLADPGEHGPLQPVAFTGLLVEPQILRRNVPHGERGRGDRGAVAGTVPRHADAHAAEGAHDRECKQRPAAPRRPTATPATPPTGAAGPR